MPACDDSFKRSLDTIVAQSYGQKFYLIFSKSLFAVHAWQLGLQTPDPGKEIGWNRVVAKPSRYHMSQNQVGQVSLFLSTCGKQGIDGRHLTTLVEGTGRERGRGRIRGRPGRGDRWRKRERKRRDEWKRDANKMSIRDGKLIGFLEASSAGASDDALIPCFPFHE